MSLQAEGDIVSTEDEFPENPDENVPMVIGGALRVLNALEAEGTIGRYAIGGSIALLFYTEPLLTEDMDIFATWRIQGSMPAWLACTAVFRKWAINQRASTCPLREC